MWNMGQMARGISKLPFFVLPFTGPFFVLPATVLYINTIGAE